MQSVAEQMKGRLEIEVWRHVPMVAEFLSPQSFLTETAITFDQRWKKSIGHRFVPEFNHA